VLLGRAASAIEKLVLKAFRSGRMRICSYHHREPGVALACATTGIGMHGCLSVALSAASSRRVRQREACFVDEMGTCQIERHGWFPMMRRARPSRMDAAMGCSFQQWNGRLQQCFALYSNLSLFPATGCIAAATSCSLQHSFGSLLVDAAASSNEKDGWLALLEGAKTACNPAIGRARRGCRCWTDRVSPPNMPVRKGTIRDGRLG